MLNAYIRNVKVQLLNWKLEKKYITFPVVMSENISMCKIAHFCAFFMCDFDQFCAKFLSVNQIHNLRCENHALPSKMMRDFIV